MEPAIGSGISGPMVWLTLTTLQEVSGPQYATILQQAGVQRWAHEIPAPTDAVALTAAEMVRITQTIWTMLGESLFRLFERNMGTRLLARMADSPWHAALVERAAQRPPDDQLRWALEAYLALGNQGTTTMRLEETAEAWQVVVAPCGACLGLSGAQAPICVIPQLILRQVVDTLLDRRVRVEEVTCHAMGASTCTFAVYK